MLLLPLLALSACAAALLAAAERTEPAAIIPVDLALEPAQRWDAAISHFGGKTAGVAIKGYFLGLAKLVPKEVLALLEDVARELDGPLGAEIPRDLRQEMKALADGLGIDVGLVLALNYVYALRNLGPLANTTGPLPPHFQQHKAGEGAGAGAGVIDRVGRSGGGACTSVVATQSKDGLPTHVRNLDWNLPEDVRKLTFQCNFMQGKTLLFKGACFLGFVGMSSGMRGGASPYGVTINERADGGELLIDIVAGVLAGAWDPTHALRHILVSESTYEGAYEALRTIRLADPVYYTLSGPKAHNGHVITRNRMSVHSDRVLGTIAGGVGKDYYVFQTNYDWDKPAPSYDDRRAYALKFLDALGPQGVTTDSVFEKVISRWPVLNQHSSYTTIMVPAADTFKMYLRFNSTAADN